MNSLEEAGMSRVDKRKHNYCSGSVLNNRGGISEFCKYIGIQKSHSTYAVKVSDGSTQVTLQGATYILVDTRSEVTHFDKDGLQIPEPSYSSVLLLRTSVGQLTSPHIASSLAPPSSALLFVPF